MPDKTDPNVTIVSRNTATAVLVTVGILLPLFLFGYAIRGVCVAFGGLLLGVLLRSCVRYLRRMVPISEGTALAIVASTLALTSAGVGIWAAPQISDQLGELAEQLPADWEHLKSKLSQSPWGRWLISQTGQGSDFANAETVKTGGMVLYSALEGPILVVIVLFLGLYFAADPHLYLSGAVCIVPHRHRSAVHEALLEAGTVLERWLVGRLIAMGFVGLMTGLGLWLFGIPLAFILGLLAGLLSFIPYAGPLISTLPAVLLALGQQGANIALGVLALYIAVLIVEDYVLIPLIQRRNVALPPAVTVMAQLFGGIWMGAIGVTVATPLALVVMVLVKKMYLQYYLGDAVTGGHDENVAFHPRAV
jgi:predicted PurR-regulated permease PerM